MAGKKPIPYSPPWMRNNITGLLWAVGSTLALFGLLYACVPHAALNRATAHTRAASGCVAAADAAQAECATQMENAWYDAGAVNYERRARIKDGPRCTRVREATFMACKGNTDDMQ